MCKNVSKNHQSAMNVCEGDKNSLKGLSTHFSPLKLQETWGES